MARRQVVFLANEGDAASQSAMVRGGKGAGLVEMGSLGLPIPQSFTLTTSVCRAFLEHGTLPKRALGQLHRSIQALERQTGKVFGDPKNPLLVSVRSGAPVSMPGMMDTILNVGINAATEQGLAALTSKSFAADCRTRFETMFRCTVGAAEIPQDVYQQLHMSVQAVFQSWNTERAKAYRQACNITNWYGTAVTVQVMVFGNAGYDSGTGVVFSRNVSTGARGLFGEFLVNAQGEDVVSGKHTPEPIDSMRLWNPQLYKQLEDYVVTLEKHCGDIVDVEFTVERGNLFILQCRKAKRTPLASATFAVHQVWDGVWNKEQAVESVSDDQISQLAVTPVAVSEEFVTHRAILAMGLAASVGVVSGYVATNYEEAQRIKSSGRKVILVRQDTNPDDLPAMLLSSAIVTSVGGTTSHAAVVARGLGIPAVVGSRWGAHYLSPGDDYTFHNSPVTVDGTKGLVLEGLLEESQTAEKSILPKEANIFLRWAAGETNHKPRLDFAMVEERRDMTNAAHCFYLCEAMVADSINTPLSFKARQLKARVQDDLAVFIATYLTVAVAGELRHAVRYGVLPDLVNKLVVNFALECSDGRDQAQQSVLDRLATSERLRQIWFLETAGRIFREPGWGTNYGGHRWADISGAVVNYLTGKLPAAVFVDHAFDLQHNGGALFNKHPMTDQKTADEHLKEVLDYKRRLSGVTALYQSLSKRFTFWEATRGRPSWLNEEVRQLLAKGNLLGLWACSYSDTAVSRIRRSLL